MSDGDGLFGFDAATFGTLNADDYDAFHDSGTTDETVTLISELAGDGDILELAIGTADWPYILTDYHLIVVPATDDGGTHLTLVHDGLLSPEYRDGATAGWHAHFDLLVDLVAGRDRRDFWVAHDRRAAEYAARQQP